MKIPDIPHNMPMTPASYPLADGMGLVAESVFDEEASDIPLCGTITQLQNAWTGERNKPTTCDEPPVAWIYWVRPPHAPQNIWPTLQVRKSMVCESHLKAVQEDHPQWIRHVAMGGTNG